MIREITHAQLDLNQVIVRKGAVTRRLAYRAAIIEGTMISNIKGRRFGFQRYINEVIIE